LPAIAFSASIAPLVPAHVLHVIPSFGIGGVPLRTVRVINHFSNQFRHTVIALDNNFEAATRLAGDLDVRLLPIGRPRRRMLASLFGSVVELRRLWPDLLITYNWGAMDWAMANRLLRVSHHVHFEDGFGKAEADAQILRRVLFRRWALARCAGVIVPSRRLEGLARRVWRLPADRVIYVANGIDIDRFSTLSGSVRRPDELVIGTVAPLRAEKNLGRLLRVFASLDGSIATRLVIAGEGSERPELERLASELGIADRVTFTGWVAPESVLGTFDIFVLSSDTEQMPIALLEAMAASRAVAGVDVGDVKGMVCVENRDFIVPRDDEPALAAAIMRLLSDAAMRDVLGRNNRGRVLTEYSQERMFSAYSDIFAAGLR
jgi:L-malate glycosyltransferase